MIIEEKKEGIIESLNQNFRTILSYGEKELIPVGEFIVKDIKMEDIKKEDIPEEYVNELSNYKLTNIILEKIDDPKVQIVLPMETFLTKYSDLSKVNADKFSISSDFLRTLEGVEKEAEIRVLVDENLENLTDAETISLEEGNAVYLVNGEVQSSNYSICPVNLGVYRERIRERTFFESEIEDDGFER